MADQRKDHLDPKRKYVSRKGGGRGLTSIEESFDESISRLKDYITNHRGSLITVTRNNTDNMGINRTKITRKNDKKNYCMDILSEISHEKTWT